MKIMLNTWQFIVNHIRAAKNDSDYVIIEKEDWFDLFYGDREIGGADIQDNLFDEDIEEFVENGFDGSVSYVRKDNTWYAEVNWRSFMAAFPECPDFDKSDELTLNEEWTLDDLKELEERNSYLYGCYIYQNSKGFWCEIKNYKPVGMVIQEESKNCVVEENKPVLACKNAEEAPLTWESAVKYCLVNDIFEKAYHHYDLYWAGEANPMYACADVLELARAVMDEINQSLGDDKIYVWTGEANSERDFGAWGNKGKAWVDLVKSEAKHLCWQGNDAAFDELFDGFGMRLVFWALNHHFYEGAGIAGFHGYNSASEIIATDEWRLNSFIHWALIENENAAIEVCRDENKDGDCDRAFPWYDMADLCLFYLAKGKQDKDEQEHIKRVLRLSGLQQSRCILPAMAWRYCG